jgi:hypothetical protein
MQTLYYFYLEPYYIMFGCCYKPLKIHSSDEMDEHVTIIVNSIIYNKITNKINRNIKLKDDEINVIFELPHYMQRDIIILFNELKICRECNIKLEI